MKRSKKAFTILELLVIVAIIAILAVVVLPQFIGAIDKSKQARDLAEIDSVQTALGQFYVDNSYYPTMQGADAIISAAQPQPVLGSPQNIDFSKIYPKYLDKLPHFSYWWVDYKGKVYHTHNDLATRSGNVITLDLDTGATFEVYGSNNNIITPQPTSNVITLQAGQYIKIKDASGKELPIIGLSFTKPIGHPEAPANEPSTPANGATIMVFKTDNIIPSTGSQTDTNQVRLPLVATGKYNFNIKWGDGTEDTITACNQPEITHTYANIGTYQVEINGQCEGWRYYANWDRGKLIEIKQWGTNFRLGDSDSYFRGCINLKVTATDNLDLTGTTKLNGAFMECSSLTSIPSLTSWDTSNVVSATAMFRACPLFDQDIGAMDISNMTSVSSIFYPTTSPQNIELTTKNYTNMLIGFAKQNVKSGVSASFSSCYYLPEAQSARDTLTSKGWTITDAGPYINLTGIDITQSTAKVAIGSYIALSTSVSPSNASCKEFAWSSANPSIATVDSTGKVTGVRLGTVAITVSAKGFTDTCVVTVEDQIPFIAIMQTDKNNSLVSGSITGNNQIKLPFVSNGNYDCIVDWGDSTQSRITAYNQPETLHTYATAGTYTVKITGKCVGWTYASSSFIQDSCKLIEIKQWGNGFRLGTSGGYFAYCNNMKITATDMLDLNGTTFLGQMFARCEQLDNVPLINSWDISKVTSTYQMFYGAYLFNQSINNWDMRNVTDVNGMFAYTQSFNQPLNNWNMSSVVDMHELFAGAGAFNQPIGNWNVSRVANISKMFMGAHSFNQSLGDWNISNISRADSMFELSGISTANYDSTLIGWSKQTVKSGVAFGAQSTKYSSAAQSARDTLTSKGWTITDGGLAQ